ncbi:MAG: dihydrodipicolinate synthase family protein [Anaerolineales bacterium]|nr:MAG: dihydrodipicolinate synthase family protein [Anaerolineales bacterium]
MTGTPLCLSGIFPPIPTPFDTNGDVNDTALTDNITLWNQHALAGYVVLGSNGEAAYLGWEEKLRVLETVRRAAPAGKLVIAGTGLESTRETIHFTLEAARSGADAALVLTPHYFDSAMTSANLVQHFRMVADASPIPVILYNVPKFTHVDMDATAIAQASRHPNIIGVKDSGGNIAKIAAIVHQSQPDFQVLAGSASFLFAALTLGAVGGVLALANIAPQTCVDILKQTQAGEWDAAAELQRKMIAPNAAVTARFGIPGLKCALDILGYYGGPVRSPLLPLAEPDRQTLMTILTTAGIVP